ncbi:MAG TPA: SAM-dependent chlorinase/fluorinase [Mycobacteriales bacterium]|nr:SAM-dependent chlorinase/fluorinase [Mycobacteriales bacterium]
MSSDLRQAGPGPAAELAATRPDWVTFLSDYGLEDHLVGVCKGVVAQIAPHVRIIDICHQVTAQSVRIGASMLAESISHMPPLAVHLVLVDPARANAARPVAIRCAGGAIFVCPDNGVSSLAWDEVGGVVEVRELTNSALWEPNPSASFRGRDVFAPVAAHLASGLPMAELGPEVDPATLDSLESVAPYVHGDHVHGTVRMVDHFGNLALNVRRSDLEAAGIQLGDLIELRSSGKVMEVPFALAFGDVQAGRVAVCEDAFRAITVAVNSGRASQVLRAAPGDPVVLSRVLRHSVSGPTPKLSVVDSPPSPVA